MKLKSFTTKSMEIEKKKNKINVYIKVYDEKKIDSYLKKERESNSLGYTTKLYMELKEYRLTYGVPSSYIQKQKELDSIYSKYFDIPQYRSTPQEVSRYMEYLPQEKREHLEEYIVAYNA